MDFETLVEINKAVVALTQEPSLYSDADATKLKELLKEVEQRADNQKSVSAIPEKASLLVFKIASGQHFRAGNKRTALVSGYAFLRKNGHKISIEDGDFISVVDKAGMGAATLDEVYGVMKRLMTKSAADRKGWDSLLAQAVESNKEFLTRIGS